MTKRFIVECDICGAHCEEHETFIMEMRADLPDGQTGEVERWDVCPECKGVMMDFFKSRKQPASDVPIINAPGPVPGSVELNTVSK